MAVASLAALVEHVMAQEAVPIRRNYRGEQVCPSNYVIRGDACVSVYALRRRGLSAAERPGYYYDDGPRRRHHRGRDAYFYPRGGRAVPPVLNYRGELQCPSNFVLRRNLCVSLYD
jgi:hypothetical protein